MQNSYLGSDGEDVYDVALKLYGDISKTVKIVNDNTSIGSLNNILLSKISIGYNSAEKIAIFDNRKPVEENVVQNFIAHDGQSLYDVALMLYGDVSKAVKLIVDNPSLDSINNSKLQNEVFTYNTNETIDNSLLNYLKKEKIYFNTITPIFIAGNYFAGNDNRITEDGNERITEDGQTIIID